VYLAHGFRDLQLSDFDHLSARDLLPVLSTLRHNEFFEGVVEKDGKMVRSLGGWQSHAQAFASSVVHCKQHEE